MFEDSLSIAKAQIRHRRFYPKAHDFQSSLSYLCFDPDRIDQNLDRSWLCSTSRWNILNLYENDFLKGYTGSIRERIKKILLQQVVYWMQRKLLQNLNFLLTGLQKYG